jgi:hypothetical protein
MTPALLGSWTASTSLIFFNLKFRHCPWAVKIDDSKIIEISRLARAGLMTMKYVKEWAGTVTAPKTFALITVCQNRRPGLVVFPCGSFQVMVVGGGGGDEKTSRRYNICRRFCMDGLYLYENSKVLFDTVKFRIFCTGCITREDSWVTILLICWRGWLLLKIHNSTAFRGANRGHMAVLDMKHATNPVITLWNRLCNLSKCSVASEHWKKRTRISLVFIILNMLT